MNQRFLNILLLLVAFLALGACEKDVFDIGQAENTVSTGDKNDEDGNLVLRIVAAETRTGEDITNYWGTINFVVYQNNDKVKAITQKRGNENFGEASMKLSPGTYQVLVLAHSSNGNPSLAHPTEIKFENKNGFSDTFYYYGDVVVEETPKSYSVELERVTTCVHFVIKDEIPQSAVKMYFYYTGGSGTLNATTGYGCVASQQGVTIDIDRTKGRPYEFDLYTILREDEGTLKMEVKGMTGSNTIVEKLIREFTIPVTRKGMVNFEGSFFSDNPGDDNQEPSSNSEGKDSIATKFSIIADTVWHNITTLKY